MKSNFEYTAEQRLRLDVFLHQQLPLYSREALKNQIKNGSVLVNNKQILKPNHLVNENDVVFIQIEAIKKQDYLTPKEIPLTIVYEDDDLVVIDKQAGIATHPGTGEAINTIANAAKFHFGKNLSQAEDAIRPGIVHRLDKDTSGLMVIAKNDYSHNLLSQQIKERTLTRKYTALIWGIMNSPFGTISTLVNRSNIDHTKMMVSQKDGKPAITHYKVIKKSKLDIASMVECKLETGRTHQIRIHMAYYKHPLIGDTIYGKGFNPKNLKELSEAEQKLLKSLKRQALHSSYMKLVHPVSGKELEFFSPIENSPNAYDIWHLARNLF